MQAQAQALADSPRAPISVLNPLQDNPYGAALLHGPWEVKLFQLEAQMKNLMVKVDTQLAEAQNEAQVKAIVVEEINVHSKLVNENMRSNLLVQKRDFEGMLKRLGVNLQDALMKIKDEI